MTINRIFSFLFMMFLILACSSEGTGGTDDSPPEQTPGNILQARLENFEINELVSSQEADFLDNKPVETRDYNASGALFRKDTFIYGANGLYSETRAVDENGVLLNNVFYRFENSRIQQIERRTYNSISPDTIYTNFTYSGNEILSERVDTQGSVLSSVRYLINTEGIIYRSESPSGSSIEVIYDGDLPVTKTFSSSFTNIEDRVITYQYLETPLQTGPFRTWVTRTLGGYNNSVLINSFLFEENNEFSKYLTFGGDDLRFSYEFDESNRMIRKQIDRSFVRKAVIEYTYR